MPQQETESNNQASSAITISNSTYEQLVAYLRSSILLQQEDAEMFRQQFQNLIDAVYTISINQEKGFILEEIKHLETLLQGDYKDNNEALRIIEEYKNRLSEINSIESAFNQNNVKAD